MKNDQWHRFATLPGTTATPPERRPHCARCHATRPYKPRRAGLRIGEAAGFAEQFPRVFDETLEISRRKETGFELCNHVIRIYIQGKDRGIPLPCLDKRIGKPSNSEVFTTSFAWS